MIRISKKVVSLQSYSRVEHMDQEKFSLLSKIKYPDDLRKLSIDQLPQVCKELREDIIDEVAVNPGHFASSLGVVEITVAHITYSTLLRTASFGMWATRLMVIRFLPVAAILSALTGSCTASVLSLHP